MSEDILKKVQDRKKWKVLIVVWDKKNLNPQT